MLFSNVLLSAASLASLLPGTVASAILQPRTNTPSQNLNVNNNFETRSNNLPIGVAALEKIGVYNLLYWTFNLATLGVNGNVVAGIIPHTPSNVAAFAANTMAANGPAMITSNYQTSQITNFTLSSLYYGCVLATEEAILSTPKSCSITATAYGANNKKLDSKTFQFTKLGGLTQQMEPVSFGDKFKKVKSVVFTVSNPLTTAALIDNAVVTLFE